MVCTWLGEICSYCCLTVLANCALVLLLNKIYKPFFSTLYIPYDQNQDDHEKASFLAKAKEVNSREERR